MFLRLDSDYPIQTNPSPNQPTYFSPHLPKTCSSTRSPHEYTHAPLTFQQRHNTPFPHFSSLITTTPYPPSSTPSHMSASTHFHPESPLSHLRPHATQRPSPPQSYPTLSYFYPSNPSPLSCPSAFSAPAFPTSALPSSRIQSACFALHGTKS
ncbi:hypothetical protein FB567DRAFT_525375 [Paraphoma chrysanthemicola]|uniref:Uncharacterized protein n=1 Tax=Paraphoma chrysanthemicola TaxID=798071 RepID=A0A8K0R680_9PLEO|nr:hypothetical protein FB567DRAFT_525375 [Paraphoma chrysanthemicola]